MSRSKRPNAPRHLKAAGKRLWRAVVNAYELETHHLEILAAACEAWIDEHLDQDLSMPSLVTMFDGAEAIKLALTDAIAERRRLIDADRTPKAT